MKLQEYEQIKTDLKDTHSLKNLLEGIQKKNAGFPPKINWLYVLKNLRRIVGILIVLIEGLTDINESK